MSLLKEIIDEAVAKDGDVTRLLRLCLVLATRLKHAPLKDWVRFELEGYPPEAHLPVYRVLRGHNKGYFTGYNWKGELEIPVTVLPEEIRKQYVDCSYRGSIAECVDLVSKNSDESSLRRPWPVNLAVKYASQFANNAQCTSAWTEISASEMVALLDQVKTKVVSFALEIEDADPLAGEILGPSATPKLGQEQVTQIFNTTINDSTVQNVAVGSHGAHQSILSGVQAGDIASLLRALATLGIPAAQVRELDVALKDDQDAGEVGVGARAKAWLADLVLRAGEKAAEKGVDSLVGLAAQAISAYFALPSIP